MTPETSRRARHILTQAERCFRLARALTSRADAERLEALGLSYLEEARRVAAEEGDASK
jgi:hypothetical protein